MAPNPNRAGATPYRTIPSIRDKVVNMQAQGNSEEVKSDFSHLVAKLVYLGSICLLMLGMTEKLA